MPSTNLVQFLVRQGSNTDRQSITLASGELGITTDPGYTGSRLFVGDGVTYGGTPVASKLFWIANWSSSTLNFVQVGDIVYNISSQALFALSANPPSLSANYFQIAKNY